MTPTREQQQKLEECVKRGLLSDFVTEPSFWADWILSRMDLDSLIEYLDLRNRPPHVRAEIVEELGFDPDPGSLYSISDWKQEVANGGTYLGYDEWRGHRRESEATNEPSLRQS